MVISLKVLPVKFRLNIYQTIISERGKTGTSYIISTYNFGRLKKLSEVDSHISLICESSFFFENAPISA